MMEAALREENPLDRVENLVREAMAAEPLPEGIDPAIWEELENQPGAPEYDVWAAMTALTQEVRLQGRAFKQLDENLLPLRARLEEQLESCSQSRAQAHELGQQALSLAGQRAQDIRREAEKRSLAVLLDVHERLRRGLESCSAGRESIPPPRSWWLGGRKELAQALEVLQSLEEGYRMSLQGLEEQLQRQDVQVLDCQGQLFDPQTMNAVAMEETREHPEGTVVEVIRIGYHHRGKIFRVAQVKVARPPQSQKV